MLFYTPSQSLCTDRDRERGAPGLAKPVHQHMKPTKTVDYQAFGDRDPRSYPVKTPLGIQKWQVIPASLYTWTRGPN